MVRSSQLQNDDSTGHEDDDQLEIGNAGFQMLLLALMVTAVTTDLNAAANDSTVNDGSIDDSSNNNSPEEPKSIEAMNPNPLLEKKQLLEKLKALYGTKVFDYLEDHNYNPDGINYQSRIGLIRPYVWLEECIDHLAETAAHIACYRSNTNELYYPDFLRLLAEELHTCATWQDEDVKNGKRPSNPYEILQKQADDAYLEYKKLTSADKPPLTLDEQTKIAASMVYAIATLKDPSNPALVEKLTQNAARTVGAVSSRVKKFYGALCLVALTAVIIYSVVAIPWTGGLSLALGLALGGSLLLAGSSAGLFYSAKSKSSLSTSIHKLGKGLDAHQKEQGDHVKLKKDR